MSLLKDAMTTCRFLDEKTVPDGLGSYTSVWSDGAEFQAAFSFDDSLTARVAERQGVTGLWTVTVDKKIRIDYHKAFKRLSDGKIFRNVSKDDSETPDSASFSVRVFRAEEWELPI